jgi:hypothetical protein
MLAGFGFKTLMGDCGSLVLAHPWETAAAPAEDLQMGNPLAPASDNSIASLMLRFSLRGADSQTVSMLRRALTETLGGNTREAAIVTSVRAGLRVFPLAIEHIVREPGLAPAVPVDTITCALLRTAAISWVSGAYPAISDKLEFAALKAVGALNALRRSPSTDPTTP